METTVLEMEFLDVLGKKFKIKVDNIREDLTPEDVRGAMDTIVEKDIFFSAAGDLVSVSGANIISTTVQELVI